MGMRPKPRSLLSISVSATHRVADLAVMFGGTVNKPLNTEGDLLNSVAVLDENGDRVRVVIPMRFATLEEMHNICKALNIPEHLWPESIA